MKKRADLLLVEQELAPSRTQAQEYIKQGLVSVNGQAVKTANQLFEETSEFLVAAHSQFVSRGGEKLQGALEYTGLTVKNANVLDVGISTGGFSDCLLQNGVATVIGVDVGHDQLHPKLKNHPQVICLEGINARNLSQNQELLGHKPIKGFDLVVVDVSFISLSLILPELVPLMSASGSLLALVKPQFEVGPQGLGKGGIVKDPLLYPQVQSKVSEKCLELGLSVRDYFSSAIDGKDGNKEFFVYAQR
jgi:23S rRNA (cytidine1920-2'-O)/16S rRNA (cytidine1409-2'-O)-methyltransferase